VGVFLLSELKKPASLKKSGRRTTINSKPLLFYQDQKQTNRQKTNNNPFNATQFTEQNTKQPTKTFIRLLRSCCLCS
jgi:hypothetical protein